MLKATTETGNLGPFTIAPPATSAARACTPHAWPLPLPLPSSRHDAPRIHPTRSLPRPAAVSAVPSRDDRRKLPSNRDAMSDIVSSYRTNGQLTHERGITASSTTPCHAENTWHNLEQRPRRPRPPQQFYGDISRSAGDGMEQRIRSPSQSYPTRLRRPGIAASSSSRDDGYSSREHHWTSRDPRVRILLRNPNGVRSNPDLVQTYQQSQSHQGLRYSNRRPPPLSHRTGSGSGTSHSQSLSPGWGGDHGRYRGSEPAHHSAGSRHHSQLPRHRYRQSTNHGSTDSLTSVVDMYRAPGTTRSDIAPTVDATSFYYDYSEAFEDRPSVVSNEDTPICPKPEKSACLRRSQMLLDKMENAVDSMSWSGVDCGPPFSRSVSPDCQSTNIEDSVPTVRRSFSDSNAIVKQSDLSLDLCQVADGSDNVGLSPVTGELQTLIGTTTGISAQDQHRDEGGIVWAHEAARLCPSNTEKLAESDEKTATQCHQIITETQPASLLLHNGKRPVNPEENLWRSCDGAVDCSAGTNCTISARDSPSTSYNIIFGLHGPSRDFSSVTQRPIVKDGRLELMKPLPPLPAEIDKFPKVVGLNYGTEEYQQREHNPQSLLVHQRNPQDISLFEGPKDGDIAEPRLPRVKLRLKTSFINHETNEDRPTANKELSDACDMKLHKSSPDIRRRIQLRSSRTSRTQESQEVPSPIAQGAPFRISPLTADNAFGDSFGQMITNEVIQDEERCQGMGDGPVHRNVLVTKEGRSEQQSHLSNLSRLAIGEVASNVSGTPPIRPSVGEGGLRWRRDTRKNAPRSRFSLFRRNQSSSPARISESGKPIVLRPQASQSVGHKTEEQVFLHGSDRAQDGADGAGSFASRKLHRRFRRFARGFKHVVSRLVRRSKTK